MAYTDNFPVLSTIEIIREIEEFLNQLCEGGNCPKKYKIGSYKTVFSKTDFINLISNPILGLKDLIIYELNNKSNYYSRWLARTYQTKKMFFCVIKQNLKTNSNISKTIKINLKLVGEKNDTKPIIEIKIY